jgi:hypothetical protein
MYHGHGVILVFLDIYSKLVLLYLLFILVSKRILLSFCNINNILSIAYSRISDFQHHWHDVLVGGIVGSLVAFVAFKFILNWRHYSPRFLPYTVASPPTSSLHPAGHNNYRRLGRNNEYEQERY